MKLNGCIFYFFLLFDELLEKYNDIWKSIRNSIKKELDYEPIYNRRNSKTKIKSYSAEDTDKEMPKAGSNYTCLSVLSIDFDFDFDFIIHKCFQKNENTLERKKKDNQIH